MNKYFKHRHKIAHLSSDIQDELVERYYAKGNVKELISSYNIDIK